MVVAYLLTTVLNSTKDSEDVGGLTMEKLVQTLVSFAVVAGFAIFFLYMTGVFFLCV